MKTDENFRKIILSGPRSSKTMVADGTLAGGDGDSSKTRFQKNLERV